MKRLNVLRGKEIYFPFVEMNPETMSHLGLKEDDIVQVKDYEGVCPLIVKPRSEYPPNSAVLSPSIMFRYGLIDGDPIELVKVDELMEFSYAKLRIFGRFIDWIEKRSSLIGMPISLDENLLLTPNTSVSFIDLEPYEKSGVGYIHPETVVYAQYSGLYNYIIVVDQSKNMLDEWRGIRKMRIAQRFFKNKVLYKIRRASRLSILTFAEEPFIYINWMVLKLDLRMMFQTILGKMIENITPKIEFENVDYIELLRFLDRHLEEMDKNYPPLIAIISAKEYDYSEKEAALKMIEKLKQKFGPYIKIIGIPIGPTYGGRFETLRALTEATGGVFVEARSPRELLRRLNSISNIIDLPIEKAGEW